MVPDLCGFLWNKNFPTQSVLLSHFKNGRCSRADMPWMGLARPRMIQGQNNEEKSSPRQTYHLAVAKLLLLLLFIYYFFFFFGTAGQSMFYIELALLNPVS